MLILLGFNIFPCMEEDILCVRECFLVTFSFMLERSIRVPTGFNPYCFLATPFS